MAMIAHCIMRMLSQWYLISQTLNKQHILNIKKNDENVKFFGFSSIYYNIFFSYDENLLLTELKTCWTTFIGHFLHTRSKQKRIF